MKTLSLAILLFFVTQAHANTVCQMTLDNFKHDENSPVITMVVSRYDDFASIQLIVPAHPTWRETITSELTTNRVMYILSTEEYTGILRTKSSTFNDSVFFPRIIVRADHPARVEWLNRVGKARQASVRLSDKEAALLVTDALGKSSVVAYGSCTN